MGTRRNVVMTGYEPKPQNPTASRIEKERSIKHLHQTSHRMGLMPMLSEFLKWLELHGAVKERQSPNSMELARYKVLDGFIAIYRRDNGTITMVNGAAHLYSDFKVGRGYDLSPPPLPPGHKPKVAVKPLNTKHTPGRRRLIASRDGLECWYCSRALSLDVKEHMADGFITIEELLARAHGGHPIPENQVIACVECNGKAGVKSVAEKVDMRDKLRGHGKHAPRKVPVIMYPGPLSLDEVEKAQRQGVLLVEKEMETWMTRLWKLFRRRSSSSS